MYVAYAHQVRTRTEVRELYANSDELLKSRSFRNVCEYIYNIIISVSYREQIPKRASAAESRRKLNYVLRNRIREICVARSVRRN